MNRKDFQSAFAPAPDHFIHRIDATLKEIEHMNHKSQARNRKAVRPILIAAIIMLLTAATAWAVIAQNHTLKETLAASGANDLVAQVVDVESPATPADFSVTLDEYIWGEENLFLSCTITVPEDGKTYLAGIMTPLVDGKLADYQTAIYFDCPSSMNVYPIGGAYPAAQRLLLPIRADSAEIDNSPASLVLKAVFLTTDKPIQDGDSDANDAQQNVLYLEDNHSINLLDCAEIAALLPHKDGEWWFSEEWRTNEIDPEAVGATDWADYITTAQLTAEINTVMDNAIEFNDVKQHAFQWQDLTITVEKLHMTHFKLDLALRLERKGGFKQSDSFEAEFSDPDVGIPNYDSMSLSLAYTDAANGGAAKSLMEDIVWSYAYQKDGSLLYTMDGDGIFPISALDTLMIVPVYWTPTGDDHTYETHLDSENPIAILKPCFIEASAQDSTGDGIVYATVNGTFYHSRPDCNGMHNAGKYSIADAIADGKKPCPDCIDKAD